MKKSTMGYVVSGIFALGYFAVLAIADVRGGYCITDDGTQCMVCQDCLGGDCDIPNATVIASANCDDENEQPECTLSVFNGEVSYSANCVAVNKGDPS